MSINDRVFEETVEIKYIDRDVKVFDKVQRCEGTTKESNYEISMDINNEIYQMKKGALCTIILARQIYESKTTSKKI